MQSAEHGGMIILKFRHNMEVGHRLYLLPGKCQQIHGHSMKVTVKLYCDYSDENGYAMSHDGTVLEFGEVKKAIRSYLDTVWDHHLHLNMNDPWAGLVSIDGDLTERIPGLQTWPGDPSTENITRWIHKAVQQMIPGTQIGIRVDETGTNGVEYYG